MKMNIRCHFYNFTSLNDNPSWAGLIKRWTQLDSASRALAEATWQVKEKLNAFDELVLVSSQGSNQTDFQFAHNDKISPSLFVHTLPNVRSLTFSSITGFEGPVYCFSQGLETLRKTLYQLLLTTQSKKILLVNLNQIDKEYQCDFFELNVAAGEATHVIDESMLTDDFSIDRTPL